MKWLLFKDVDIVVFLKFRRRINILDDVDSMKINFKFYKCDVFKTKIN